MGKLETLQEQNEGTDNPGEEAECVWINAGRLVEWIVGAVEILSWWHLLVK